MILKLVPDLFVCPGCRQSFAVMNGAGDEMVLTCPIPECRRVIWVLHGPDNEALLMATSQAPDLSSGDRFVVDQFRLIEVMDDGEWTEEVLTGPADQLTVMARDLNADPPADEAELVHRVRDLIKAARPQCEFHPGPRLRNARRIAIEAGQGDD